MSGSKFPRMRRHAAAVLVATLSASVVSMAQEISPALKARVWDIHIEIPAGGYRATKPIELNGELEIKIEPGAYLEGIDFQSKDRAQRWAIDGAFLKDVRIGPPIGGRLVAKNSILEDCLFYKKASNFDPFWSTRWTFENCVITRNFMHAPVNMADYSIVARSCTFIGIEFPGLGLKERTDPVKYLQSDNFIFDRCRFVRCKIPPTVLAATRNCVFEQCTFPPMRGSWPPEATEIKVTAYWDGAATPTKPSVRKPLVLEFEKLPPDFGPVGSTLDFTHSGGVVTSKDIPKPPRIELVGTQPSTARELSTE